MKVRTDSGRRWVEVEVEVSGTPERVWEAIATGPGVSSWFMPTKIDGRVGGAVTLEMGGPEFKAPITSWDPPHRFTAEAHSFGPDGPLVATEWVVETRSGDTCTVRVVHSLFADGDDWDDQLTSTVSGWTRFFRILSLRLATFADQPCAAFHFMGAGSGPAAKIWDAMQDGLALAGHVETNVDDQVLVHLDSPGAGIVSVCAYAMGPHQAAQIGIFMFGDAADVIADNEAHWRAWLSERFS